MAKRKRTNNDLQNTSQKLNIDLPVVFFYLHLPMVQSTLHVYYTPKKATSIIAIMNYE